MEIRLQESVPYDHDGMMTPQSPLPALGMAYGRLDDSAKAKFEGALELLRGQLRPISGSSWHFLDSHEAIGMLMVSAMDIAQEWPGHLREVRIEVDKDIRTRQWAIHIMLDIQSHSWAMQSTSIAEQEAGQPAVKRVDRSHHRKAREAPPRPAVKVEAKPGERRLTLRRQ